MIPSPFAKPATTPQQSWIGRLLRRPDVPGATASIKSALASHWPVADGTQISAILSKHRVFGSEAKEVGRGLLLNAIRAFSGDGIVTEQELEVIRLLENVLGLTRADVEKLQVLAASEVYSSTLKDALQDGLLTPAVYAAQVGG